MKNSLNNGKKVLSLVLSVLMIMSCFVFAPVASAADSINVKVRITVTKELDVIVQQSKYLKVVVTEKNGTVHEQDIFKDLCKGIGGYVGTSPINKGGKKEVEFSISSQVSQIAIVYILKAPGRDPTTTKLGLKAEAWLTSNGKSIINTGSKESIRKQGYAWQDNLFDGETEYTWVLVSSGDFVSDVYNTYLIKFIGLNSETLKTENVLYGNSATAPALPTKAPDDGYHYSVSWDKGSSAWTGVRENADIKAVATPTAHNFGDWKTTTEATCTTDGSKTRTCADCGYVQTSKINAFGHSYGDWVITTKQTCTTAGERTKTCATCGNKISERLPALGHEMLSVNAKAPTCTEPGYTWHTHCSRCDYTEDYVVIPATGHSFGEWVVTEESTCIKAGTKRRDCKNCDYFETADAELAAHTPKAVPAVEATCTTSGLTEGSVCSVCGKVLTAQTTISALGHDMKEVGKVDSTCTKEGVINYKCSRCDHTSQTAIPKKDHSFSADFTVVTKATCTTNGKKAKLCTVCSAEDPDSATVIPAKGHAYGNWSTVNEVSCTENGLEKRVCTNEATDEYEACEAFETRAIKAPGHNMTETVDEKYLDSPADCVNDAVYKKSCSRCDYTEGTFVAEETAIGHNFKKEIVDNAHLKSPATCEAKAVYYYNCSRCDVISTEDTFEYGNALGHDYVGAITTRPTETEKGLATYTCTRDASHVYTLAMDLADYSGFDASLEALKEIANKDLTAENKALVEAAIAEAEALSRNLIAGVKGQTYTDPLDRYKHDFGEQDLINAAKAKLDEAIKTITDKGDDAFNKYTVTFEDYDGSVIATQTVVSGKSATAPADRTRACDADNHYAFIGWNGKYENVTKDETVVAEYKAEAHNFVENTARYVAPSKNEDGTWSDGVIVKECTGCSCEKSENVARADYESRYDPALEKVKDILDNPELDPTVKEEIEKILDDHNIPIPEDYDERDQKKVNDAAEILEGIVGKYTDEDGNVKEDFLKKYTITFIWNGDKDIQHLVKGAKIVAPSVSDYVSGGFNHRFLGWDKDVPETVTGDATFTAVYSQPRSMDDVKEVIKDAEEVINNDDYYDEDQKKVEEAKKELEDYLEDVGVDLDKDQNPVEKGSKEDEKITELVEKLRDAIDNAKKNKANRDNNKHQTGSFMHWLTRLLILVRHLLGMV